MSRVVDSAFQVATVWFSSWGENALFDVSTLEPELWPYAVPSRGTARGAV